MDVNRSLAIVVIIARSKLVPDFAFTVHIVHLVVVSLYAGRVPRNAMWWATMLASSGLAVALGIWGCRYRELQPIFFGGRRILPAAGTAAADAATEGGEASASGGLLEEEGAQGDEEMGFSRGRGRGRGRDSAGEYEMAPMEAK